MTRDSLLVYGAGTMGRGIAQVAAASGLEVFLIDVSREAVERSLDFIRKNLDDLVSKKTMGPEVRQATLDRLRPVTTGTSHLDVPFVIEAIPENLEAKSALLHKLDGECGAETILATNTSSISITKLAAATNRPDRVIGMHFMNPVPRMALVEIVRGISTSQSTYDRTRQLTLKLQKTPVEVNDAPGFVSNRILMPMLNEAVFALMEGVGRPEAIDTVMKLGMNHPMGPFALADLIGLDVCLDIMNVLYDGFKDSKYRPCPLLQKMVDAGHLGRKSGRGFYEYVDR